MAPKRKKLKTKIREIQIKNKIITHNEGTFLFDKVLNLRVGDIMSKLRFIFLYPFCHGTHFCSDKNTFFLFFGGFTVGK